MTQRCIYKIIKLGNDLYGNEVDNNVERIILTQNDAYIA